MSLILARNVLVGAASLFAASWTTAPQVEPVAEAAEAQACLRVEQIHNFRSAGPEMYVRARVSDIFRLEVTPCPGLDFADGLALVPDGPSSRLCPGDRARLRAAGAGTLTITCNVRLVSKLTPEEVAALPDSVKP